jgi:hypothetical protein
MYRCFKIVLMIKILFKCFDLMIYLKKFEQLMIELKCLIKLMIFKLYVRQMNENVAQH